MRAFIIVTLLITLNALRDFPIDQIRCSTPYEVKYLNDYRRATMLTGTDTTIIEIISPFSLLASILVIVLYIKFPAARQQPGDIILALAVSEIFLVIGYLSTVIYNAYNSQTQPVHFQTFCNVTGYLIVLSFCAEFIYNISFCVFFIVIVKNVFKSWEKQKWVVHIVCPIVLMVVAIILLLTGEIGVSLFGVCGIKLSTYSPFFRSILIIAYTIGLFISSIYFKKRIPQFEQNASKREDFTKYNYRYILSVTVNLICQTTCDLIAAISCQYDYLQSKIIRVAVTFSNTFTLLTPIIIFAVMFSHPEVQKSIKHTLIAWFGENRQRRKSSQADGEVLIEMRGLLSSILSINKSRMIYSILCAIVIEDRQVTGLPNLRQINQWNFKDKMIIKMNTDIVKQFDDLSVENLKVLDVEITSYCPRVFKTLMRSDGFQSLASYLNPRTNKQSIQKLTQASGGKSGQFFFFSYDNQIILKTLTKKQLNVLLSRIQQMVEYYQKNPNSLITKVYGVYTLLSKQTGEQHHLFVMKNLSGCDRKFITRMYDLKGSKHERQVKKSYDQVTESVNETMKDIDFQLLERRLEIDNDQAKDLRQILIEDSVFLRDCKLIDYSLIIMKIKLEDYLKENQILFDQFKSKQVNPYAIIPSNVDKSIAYVIGIIDYLETWTVKKKSEKFTKVLLFFKFQSAEDVSAQGPTEYSDRFIEKVVKRILDC